MTHQRFKPNLTRGLSGVWAVVLLFSLVASPEAASDDVVPWPAQSASAAAGVSAPTPLRSDSAAGEPAPPEPPEVVRRDPEGRTSIRATRISTPLHIDGVLDEEVYRTVRSIGGFIQQDPKPGAPATEPTEVWILFDDKNLYVAAFCHDSHPERIVENEMRRDGNIPQNENFTIALDTFHDRRNGILFQTNSLGALRDALITDEGNLNVDWNTIWDVQTSRNERGWTLEMEIPFKSLRYAAGRDQTWGVNIRRVVRWKNEFSNLTPIPSSFAGSGVYRVSFGATMVGLQAPATTRTFEVKPYAISGLRTDRAATPAVSNKLSGDTGVDVKYGLSRGLTADLSYNTDFAQVEVDDQQVNLTRFSLLFPEKREFFLEGQGIFSFAGAGQVRGGPSGGGGGGGGGAGGGGESASGGMGGTNLTPVVFFSRRLGLSDGNPVPIVAGARVTGRTGPYTLGLLNIGTARSDDLDAAATNFSVVRVRRDILRRSTIGLIATNRTVAAGGSGSNQAFGIDANFSFFKSIDAKAYYARTRTPGRNSDSASYLGEFLYNADRYGFLYQHLVVGENFNPDMGFLFRNDFRRHYVGARFSPRPKSSKKVRKLIYEANLDYITNGRYRLETRETQALFGIEFQNADRFRAEYTNSFEHLSEPFNIAANVTLPVGSYEFQMFKVSYNMGPQRRLMGNISAGRGGFYNGTLTEVGYGGRVELTRRFLLEPRISLNWVDLREGRFRTTLLSARPTLLFTPRTYFSALLQYNSSNHALSANLRYRWEYRPGSELFVVYSEGRDTDARRFPALQNRGFVVKLTRLLRF